MSRFTRFTAAAAALATVALGACSDTMVEPPSAPRVAPAGGPNAVITPVLSNVIVGSGSFANAINPSNAGRGTGAFWDNHSSDEGQPFWTGLNCNIGFFAIGSISGGCTAFGNPNNSVVNYANYYGSGAGSTGSPDFMFNGQYEYDVKVVGAYSFGFSTIGYFTKVGTTYTFFPQSAWHDKDPGAITFTPPANGNWGFFATNDNFTTDPDGNPLNTFTCGGNLHYVCSDATGGFSPAIPGSAAPPQPQQFALFINSTGDQFLVGFEDNILHLWAGDDPVNNPTNQDSDYQDYIFNIVPHVIPAGGCTFTKGWYRNHGSSTVTAVDGRTKAQAQAIFAATPGKPGGVTWQGGNDLLNLYQQLLAAILNGGTTGPANVQAAIAAAQLGTGGSGLNITTTLTQTQISTLMNTLDDFNSGKDAGFPHCGDTN